MKKICKTAVVLIVILAAVTGWFAQYDVQADVSDAVKIDIKVGFDDFYKIGHTTPVYFEIENKLRDINGELQVEMPNRLDSITIYAMNVNLPKDSTKKFVMNIPVTVFNTKLKVNLAENGKILTTNSFRVDPGSSAETIAVGILSDDFESVKYINKITMKNFGSYSTKNVRLDENSFSENIDALKTFNVIVINNYDTTKLSKAQYEALKKWVAGGGVLVIGTGHSHNKTLAAFKDDFITGEVGEIRRISTYSLHKMAESKTLEAMSLNVLEISMKDATPVIEDDGFPLLQKIEKGKGAVAVASFDFGMEPLSTWIGNSTFADKAISAVLPLYYQSEIFQKESIVRGNLYQIDSALRNIPELPMPKTSHLVFIYAVYIILAAPLSYFILKRLDKRELMWIIVPAVSIVFSGVVYFSGIGTRLNEPVTNIISLVDIDNSGTITPQTYAGVFTPNKDNIRIEAADGSGISPLMMGYDYYPRPINNENTPKRIDSKVIVSPRTVLEFYKSGIWSMRTLALDSDNIITGKLESNLNYVRGEFTGTITNTSGFDLDECYIITPYQYADIGPIKNGETRQVNVKPSNYFGQRYDLINSIYKDPYSGPQPSSQRQYTSEEMAKFRMDHQKRQILDYSLTNEMYQGFGAKLIAWSSTPVSKKIMVNGKETKTFEKSFITSRVNLSFRDGNSVEYPFGFIEPEIINNMDAGNYDVYGRTFYGRGSFEIHYKIDSNINLESVKIQFSAGNAQRIRQYIWDTGKGDWVEGDYMNFEIQGSLLEKYIDDSNRIKLKIEMDDDNVQLPQISVKGSVK